LGAFGEPVGRFTLLTQGWGGVSDDYKISIDVDIIRSLEQAA